MIFAFSIDQVEQRMHFVFSSFRTSGHAAHKPHRICRRGRAVRRGARLLRAQKKYGFPRGPDQAVHGPRHGCSDGGWRVCRNAEDPRAPVPMVRRSTDSLFFVPL